MGMIDFAKVIEKGSVCKRLDKKEAHYLVENITPSVLHEIGQSALKNRFLRYGNNATYILNVHINPTNICIANCSFCNYSASIDSNHAYVMDEFEIFNKLDKILPTEVHIVGGLNDIWPYSRNLELIKNLRKRYPKIYIKAFTAVEIEYFAKTSNLKVERVLDELKYSGLDAMTGGGAENFSEELYKKHWKNKTTPHNWIKIHEMAHFKGIPTNSTMLFGFGDSWHDRINHLLILRDIQDRTNGFSCFIPLPFQPGRGKFVENSPTPLEILITLALSRLILDNIPHIKSYWPMMGVAASAVGLSWGADDIDGTIDEEKIAHFSGATSPIGMTSEKMIETIKIAGFIPRERKGNFELKLNELS